MSWITHHHNQSENNKPSTDDVLLLASVAEIALQEASQNQPVIPRDQQQDRHHICSKNAMHDGCEKNAFENQSNISNIPIAPKQATPLAPVLSLSPQGTINEQFTYTNHQTSKEVKPSKTSIIKHPITTRDNYNCKSIASTKSNCPHKKNSLLIKVLPKEPSPPPPKNYKIIRKKFNWRHYPELQQFLIHNRDEYIHHSTLNYTSKQKEYNNILTNRMFILAAQHGYMFHPDDFSFVTLRDRIRCYYKGYIQHMKKNGVVVGYAARNVASHESMEVHT